MILALISFLSNANLSAQGCDKIVFKVTNTSQCCYNLTAQNMTDNCFQQLNLSFADGVFTSYTPAAGWQAFKVGPKEYNVRPSMGFIPFGNVNIGSFCVSGAFNQDLTILWDNLCIAEGCETLLPVTVCIPDNVIKGVKYVDIGCEGKPYTNQPVLADWAIELLDEFSQIIANTQTDDKGNFSFTDLAPGKYTCREGTQTGWKSSMPKNGQHSVTLTGSKDTSVVNFGNCPTTCSCDSVFIDLIKDSASTKEDYLLTIINRNNYCFKEIIVENITGDIAKADIILNSWKINTVTRNKIIITGPNITLPSGQYIPANLRFTSNLIDNVIIRIIVTYNSGNGIQDCIYEISIPLLPDTPEQCCPIEMIETGNELLINGDFSIITPGFGFQSDYTYFTSSPHPLGYSIANSNLVNSLNSQWYCNPRSGNLISDYFMIVDGSTDNTKIVYQQDVNIMEFGIYRFCGYLNNLVIPGRNLNLPLVQLLIDDNIIDSELLQEKPNKWILMFGSLPLQPGLHTVKIKCASNTTNGNDFAIDDLSFKKCITGCNAYIIVKDIGCGEYIFQAIAEGSAPYNYQWDFGDGTQDTGETVKHKFLSSGLKTVKLTVVDSNGCKTSASITVNPIIP